MTSRIVTDLEQSGLAVTKHPAGVLLISSIDPVLLKNVMLVPRRRPGWQSGVLIEVDKRIQALLTHPDAGLSDAKLSGSVSVRALDVSPGELRGRNIAVFNRHFPDLLIVNQRIARRPEGLELLFYWSRQGRLVGITPDAPGAEGEAFEAIEQLEQELRWSRTIELADKIMLGALPDQQQTE